MDKQQHFSHIGELVMPWILSIVWVLLRFLHVFFAYFEMGIFVGTSSIGNKMANSKCIIMVFSTEILLG